MATRYHVRCRKCRARRVLRRHPDHYGKLPKCGSCGASSYHVDKWMNARNTKAAACNCGGGGAYVNRKTGYAWPHRKGSLFCQHRADGSNRYPGDADFNHPSMGNSNV